MSNDDPTNPEAPRQTPPPPPPGYGNAGPFGGHMPAAPQYGDAMPSYSPTPSGPVTRPKSMDLAVRLMQAGGALSILSLLSVFFMQGSLKESVAKQMRDADPSVTQSTIDAAITVGLAIGVVIGLIGAGLWFWMAAANGKGRSWARILATVFFAISLLMTVLSFGSAQSALSRILGLVSLAIGAAAIFFMYQKESTAYYNAVSGPRR